MEWLKKLLGEEKYNSLGEAVINTLKESFGETEYVPNDATKIIPKSVFNAKLEEIKHLKTQITTYEQELESRKDMITTTEYKQKLIEAETNFKQQLIEADNNWKSQIAKTEKETALTNFLVQNDAKYPAMLLREINLDDVVIKDGKILNGDDIIKPLKTSYVDLFNKATGNPPPQGSLNTPPATGLESLINKYNEAQKAGRLYELPSLMNQIQVEEQKLKTT